MADQKLFRVTDGIAKEIEGRALALERQLQTLIEANMEAVLGVRLLAIEYHTGPRHRGRIDSLGLDENGAPVIVPARMPEYPRSVGPCGVQRMDRVPEPLSSRKSRLACKR